MTYDRRQEALVLADGTRRPGDLDTFLLQQSDLIGMRPTDLRNALKAARNGEYIQADVTLDEEVDEEYSVREQVSFLFHEGKLGLEARFPSDAYGTEEEAQSALSPLLNVYLRRNRAALASIDLGEYSRKPLVWNLGIDVSTRVRDVANLYRIGEGALALLEAHASGELTRVTALDLIRSGHAHTLIGQEEGPWLDVKSAHYDLKSPTGKIAIAQAVARFANGEHGGIIVVGMRGKRIPGGEVISSICPVPVNGRTLRNYQQAIEQHLYPPPDYLDIEVAPVDGGSLVLLHIPPQPEEYKPFLVHGATVDGNVEGAFISIVRRRGESSIPITAPAIHASLAAGRALLRRGELPRDEG
ncbi:ATP-binding protein [Streptomyces sp. NPDC005507]|uniref:AlbA family DNA-binding domain-containing protein n=1 Tax=Streptomyces sp. NPDC005507 TaxID=3154885 RepID=UPI00339E6BC7